MLVIHMVQGPGCKGGPELKVKVKKGSNGTSLLSALLAPGKTMVEAST